MRCRVIAAAVAVALPSCGHGSSTREVGGDAAEIRAFHYTDNSGLVVGTYGATIAGQLPKGANLEARAIADHVVLDSRRMLDPSTDVPGKVAADVVTSASATAGGGSVAREWRYEGLATLGAEAQIAGRPFGGSVTTRASTEPDYRSVSAAGRIGAELFERNLGLSLQVGYGRDRVIPVEKPVGQEGNWPAGHHRVSGVVAASQILTPALVLSGSAGATFQRGQLASPYRNAIVKTTLFPEAVPRARNRYTAYLGLSAHLTAVALDLRGGAYADSWGVRALIPEATLAAPLDDGVLATIRYRLYRQWPASFYRRVYPERIPVMTGDLRLGSLLEHAGALEVKIRLAGVAGGRSLSTTAGYELSILEYRSASTRIIAHVFGIGMEGRW